MAKKAAKTSRAKPPSQSKSALKRGRPAKQRNRLSASDSAALKDFCSQVQVPEVLFTDWTTPHQDLDLTVRVFITALQAASGGIIQVTFSRTTSSTTPDGGSEVSRERVGHTLEIPNSLNGGASFLLPGLGDRKGPDSGDLKIIVEIRPNV